MDDKVALSTFMGGFQPSKFLFFLSKDLSQSMTKQLPRAQSYMNAKDTLLAHRSHEDKHEERKRSDQPSMNAKARSPKKNWIECMSTRDNLGLQTLTEPAYRYTPLNIPVEHILFQIQDD